MAHCVIGIISSSLAVSRILQSAPGLVAIPLVDGLSLIPLDEDAHSLSPTPCSGDGAINRALACLGVVRNGAFDEFEYVGLNRYRYTSDWIEAAISQRD